MKLHFGLNITQERQWDRQDKFEKCLASYALSDPYFGHTLFFLEVG